MNEFDNDQITPETRIVGGAVIIALALAFLALYVEPDHTDWDFAWTILPRTSALLIGAGYTAGAYFFVRLLSNQQWHRFQAGFLPITAFTICMFVATLLHLDRFHQGAMIFYLWTVIYAITPFLVPFVWWRNRRNAAHGLEANDVRFSTGVRWGLALIASIGTLICLMAFIQPTILISAAPWKLTPLTARIFSGWNLLTSLVVGTIAYDGRWSAARMLVQSAMVGLGLTLLAMPRMWKDFDVSKPGTYLFAAGIPLTLLTLLVIQSWLDRMSQQRSG